MDKIEKIRGEVEGLRKHYLDREEYAFGWNRALDKVLSILDTLEEEPINEELKEAADCYKDMITPEVVDDSEHAYSYETYTEYQIADAFKAGAEWQKAKDQETIELAEDHAMLAGMEKMKEQMMKEARVYTVEQHYGKILGRYLAPDMVLNEQAYNVGDKVRIIVLKED